MNPWAKFKSEIIEHCLLKNMPTIECVELATFAEKMVTKHLLLASSTVATPEAFDAISGPCCDSFINWVTRKNDT